MNSYVYYPDRFSEETPFHLEYFPPEKLIPTHEIDMHNFVHLGVVLAGSYDGWGDGYIHSHQAGSVWLTAPLEPHTALRQSDDCEAVAASFPIEELGRGFAGWKLPFLAPFSLDLKQRTECLNRGNAEKCLALGKALRDLALLADQDVCTRFEQWLLIHEIFAVILKPFQQAAIPETEAGLERIRPALVLPQKQMGKPVSLEEAARACNLSASRFGELFHAYMGKSFCQYEIRFRLSNAKNLVATSDRTLKEIAATWGFYDTSHFTRLFHQYYGVTPGAYRKNRKIGK